jgi:hypothetical protein
MVGRIQTGSRWTDAVNVASRLCATIDEVHFGVSEKAICSGGAADVEMGVNELRKVISAHAQRRTNGRFGR